MKPQKNKVSIFPLLGLPEFKNGDDIAYELFMQTNNLNKSSKPQSGDILIITQKAVSKCEGQTIHLETVTPTKKACKLAKITDKDPRLVQLIINNTKRFLAIRKGLIIVETLQGIKCANAGIDSSNVPGNDTVTLLPSNPNKSAKNISKRASDLFGIHLPVILTDSFGRPWREGILDMAIGTYGMKPLLNLIDTKDAEGQILHSTIIAIADSLAAAANLVVNKNTNVPVVIIRGYHYELNNNINKESLERPMKTDIFI